MKNRSGTSGDHVDANFSLFSKVWQYQESSTRSYSVLGFGRSMRALPDGNYDNSSRRVPSTNNKLLFAQMYKGTC
jgi:hypothetical protein